MPAFSCVCGSQVKDEVPVQVAKRVDSTTDAPVKEIPVAVKEPPSPPASKSASQTVEYNVQTLKSVPSRVSSRREIARGALTGGDEKLAAQYDLAARHAAIMEHFPTALGVDDFMARLEQALSAFGFSGDNSIAMTNLCRDEVTIPLKDKIESVFGSSFNTNGLGAVLTCGLVGMGAGFSHSPVTNGKEHYVMFALPHIAINSVGDVGVISRPGRSKPSCACGALAKACGEFKSEGFDGNCKAPGLHDALDPEYSILKQRLARRARYEKLDHASLDLVATTKLADRTISNDLEFLAEKAVDTKKANYAVVTGVQIHNWASELTQDTTVPSLEFVAVSKCFVVIDGVKHNLDLHKIPALAPRQLQLMALASMRPAKDEETAMISHTAAGTLKEVPLKYLTERLGVTKAPEDVYNPGAATWTSQITVPAAAKEANAPTMVCGADEHTSFKQVSNKTTVTAAPADNVAGAISGCSYCTLAKPTGSISGAAAGCGYCELARPAAATPSPIANAAISNPMYEKDQPAGEDVEVDGGATITVNENHSVKAVATAGPIA